MENVSKHFRGTPALTSASIRVDPGEIHALIGQNGAGKSTLIKILTGVHRRDEGTIQVDGTSVDFSSPAAAQQAGVVTIYQEVNLIPQLSVAENIFLGRFPRRRGLLDWSAMRSGAEQALAELDINIDVTRPLDSYRVATQQMTAIARAISIRAKLLVMDEPTSSLADKEVETLFAVMRTLQSRGVSMIFVSHRMSELYEVCKGVTILRDGATVAQARLADMDRHELVTSMLGRAATIIDQGARTTERPAQGAPIIRVKSLSVAPRVHDVSLDVVPGRVLGVAGLLGSGRSETLQGMFGAGERDSGSIEISGKDVNIRTPQDAIARGIAYLPEDRRAEGIVPSLSVRENLTLALLPRLTKLGIVDRRRQKHIVDDFIKRLGIKARPDQLITELSGGNQQKVLLARWMCMEPSALLLDEPTRGIDVNAKAEILLLINELAIDGLGVLMVSSELEEIISASDDVVVIRDGNSTALLHNHELSQSALIDAMAQGAATVAGEEPSNV